MKITTIKGITIYTWEELERELGSERYKDFSNWLTGQTCLAGGCYTWDYERWANSKVENMRLK